MKVIFLDIDGVLNSDASLMVDYRVEGDLILNLKYLVDKTDAKIILSSSWRLYFKPLRKLMDKLDKVNLHISGMTQDSVSLDWIKEQGYEHSLKYVDDVVQYDGFETTRVKVSHDRGAEILKWLSEHDVESFVILDDEGIDIKSYFSKEFVKTNFHKGLTKEDVEKAISILNEKKI